MRVALPADLIGDEIDRSTCCRSDDPIWERVIAAGLGRTGGWIEGHHIGIVDASDQSAVAPDLAKIGFDIDAAIEPANERRNIAVPSTPCLTQTDVGTLVQ
jgi:hypothetical protein